jgi:ubiquinone biosynthesis protein
LPTLRIQRRLKSIGRFREIALVLGKYGFDEVLARMHLPLHLRALLKRPVGRKPTSPERLRLVLEELGPTFIKFGQTLSTRSHLLPPEYAAELAKLQDRVSAFPFEGVESMIREDLGKSPQDLFSAFDRTPFASASIAQVHHASLEDGRKVCVKVQRPGVRQTLEVDIMILEELARLLEAYVPESRQYDPVGLIKEFKRTSRREVDFTIEAANIGIFRQNFEGDADFYIPPVFKHLSSSRVLTTEYVDGIKISDVDRIRQADLDTSAIARTGARGVFKQVFDDGIFHADPHPGNLFVMPDGRIAPVDFGIVGRLTKPEIDNLADFLIGIVRSDENRLLGAMTRLDILPTNVERRDVIEDLMLFVDKYGRRGLGDIDFKEVFAELVSFMRRHKVRVRTEFMLLGKALSTYQEVGRMLDPDFKLMEQARPFVRKLMRRNYLLSALWDGRGRNLGEIINQISSIPSDLAHIISLAKEGKLKIEFEHLGLEKLTGEIERSSNRISFSLIVAALVVASSLILVLGGEVLSYRGFGIAGFAFAAIVSMWLLINMIRSGKV